MCERSSEIRLSRPQREKPQDGADDLLHAEKHHLLNIKQSLETQLKAVQQQLQVNDLFLCVCLSVCSSVSVYLSVCLSVCLSDCPYVLLRAERNNLLSIKQSII